MKKIYALAALVLTAGLSASAATNAPEKAMKAISLQEYMETSSASLPIKAKAQGPAKAINSVSDLYGLYSMSYRGASTKDTLNHIEAGMITEVTAITRPRRFWKIRIFLFPAPQMRLPTTSGNIMST